MILQKRFSGIVSWCPQHSVCLIGPLGSLPGFIFFSASTSKADDKDHAPSHIFWLQLLVFSSYSFTQLEKKKVELFSKIIAFLSAADGATYKSLYSFYIFAEGEKQALCFPPHDFSSLCLKDIPETQLSHFKQVDGKCELEISNLFFRSRSILFCQHPSSGKGVLVWQASLPLWQGGPGWHADRQRWTSAGLFFR